MSTQAPPGDLKFIKDSLKRYDDPSFRTALHPDWDAKFRRVLQSAKVGKMSYARAKDELRRILRQDYISKVRNFPQISVNDGQTFKQWVEETGDQAPVWIRKYLNNHPDLAKRTNLQLTVVGNNRPEADVLKTYGFRMMLDNSVMLERFFQLSAGTLSRQEPAFMSVTLLPDELFEGAPKLLCREPVRLWSSSEISDREGMMKLRKRNGWPELITRSFVKRLHDHVRHPYVALFHDRQLHAILLNQFSLKVRRDLVRLAEVLESLPPPVKKHLKSHAIQEVLEGAFLAPSFKNGKAFFETAFPYRRALLHILKSAKGGGNLSSPFAGHLLSAMKKISFGGPRKRGKSLKKRP